MLFRSFDRTARLVLLVGTALLAAQPLGRCGRAEVGAAIAAAGTHRGSWPGTKTATAATRPWAAKAAARTAGARSKSLSGRPWRTIFARTRFADGEAAPLERLCIEPLDDLLGLSAVEELDEGKATRTPGLAIHRHDNVGGFGDGREVGAKISFAGPVGEVPDEQTDSQGFLVSVGGSDSISETRKSPASGGSYVWLSMLEFSRRSTSNSQFPTPKKA